jgi:hypothetical protein
MSLREAEFANGERSDEAIPRNGTESPLRRSGLFQHRPSGRGAEHEWIRKSIIEQSRRVADELASSSQNTRCHAERLEVSDVEPSEASAFSSMKAQQILVPQNAAEPEMTWPDRLSAASQVEGTDDLSGNAAHELRRSGRKLTLVVNTLARL